MSEPASILLLSDLHLPTTESPLRETFHAFLRGPARSARAVYILGDLFEYWVGDDVGIAAYRSDCLALRELTEAGVQCGLIRGNRDYLLGPAFSQLTGFQILPDPYRLHLGSADVLLSHGDIWCTQDHAYQRYRRISQSAWGRAFFLSWPRAWRIAVAERLRKNRERRPAGMDPTILDVAEDAVRAAFRGAQVRRIIHGHTHRPAVHDYPEFGADTQRWVLADWRVARREYLELSEHGWLRHNLAAITATS